MELSDFGRIVETEWLKSFEMRDELFLDEYIIMPNHLHAIIILKKSGKTGSNGSGGLGYLNELDSDELDFKGLNFNGLDSNVETHGRASQRSSESRSSESRSSESQSSRNPSFYREPQSISSFIGGFKSVINTKIGDYIDENQLDIPKYNRNNHFFQPNYYDRIIRNSKEYLHIKRYIQNNPSKWNDDTLN
ncbi:MAG: hypothetical protein K9I68_10185 [Bacteroidales bacterium]|nr:hypothetical protein [Bacteroidales bacterium]